MMKFWEFLKTIEGSKILSSLYKKTKLNKKVKLSGLDDDGLTHVTMLKHQLSELSPPRKRRRAEIVAEIVEQRRRIVLLEKEAVKVESHYVPVCEYVSLDEVDFLRRCYDMYVAEYGERGEEVRELNEEVIRFVKGEYQETVQRVHMHEFVVSENRKDVLKVWDEERNKTEHGVSL